MQITAIILILILLLLLLIIIIKQALTYPLESAVMKNSLSSVTAAAPKDSVGADTARNLPRHRP